MFRKMNPIIVAFILSEAFFWSAWNSVTPILSVYVVNTLPEGTIRTAAFGFTLYLFMRVITGLVVSNYLTLTTDKKRMFTDITGMLLLSGCYLLIAFIPSLISFYIFFIIAGVSLGISNPAKFSMFAINLGRSQISKTWGTYDAITFTGMGIAAAMGGLIANEFGFKTLFIIASIVNIIGILPYVHYNYRHQNHKHYTEE